MAKDLLVRNIPERITTWLDQERSQHKMSQQEFVLSLLDKFQTKEKTEKVNGVINGASNHQETHNLPFTFIDLFAGIGGFRIALERVGGKCIFTSEWDKYSQKTYKSWFGDLPEGDIREITPQDIPDHDVLAAGFPCQPFSLAGVSKKNSLGMAHGFKDRNQGNLFFYLATIIETKHPPIVFLENVKNLKSHDQGRTWDVIEKTLDDLGYKVFSKIFDAAKWVPQHRERVFIIALHRKVFGENPPFEFPESPTNLNPKLEDILEKNPDPKYTLSEHLWNYLQDYAERHRIKGNGFGYGIANPKGITRTLSARYHKDGSEILISQGKNKPPRRLTPRECARLMGFPDHKIVVSDTQAYRQFGNAVVVPVVEATARQLVKLMSWHLSTKNHGCLVKTKKSTK